MLADATGWRPERPAGRVVGSPGRQRQEEERRAAQLRSRATQQPGRPPPWAVSETASQIGSARFCTTQKESFTAHAMPQARQDRAPAPTTAATGACASQSPGAGGGSSSSWRPTEGTSRGGQSAPLSAQRSGGAALGSHDASTSSAGRHIARDSADRAPPSAPAASGACSASARVAAPVWAAAVTAAAVAAPSTAMAELGTARQGVHATSEAMMAIFGQPSSAPVSGSGGGGSAAWGGSSARGSARRSANTVGSVEATQAQVKQAAEDCAAAKMNVAKTALFKVLVKVSERDPATSPVPGQDRAAVLREFRRRHIERGMPEAWAAQDDERAARVRSTAAQGRHAVSAALAKAAAEREEERRKAEREKDARRHHTEVLEKQREEERARRQEAHRGERSETLPFVDPFGEVMQRRMRQALRKQMACIKANGRASQAERAGAEREAEMGLASVALDHESRNAREAARVQRQEARVAMQCVAVSKSDRVEEACKAAEETSRKNLVQKEAPAEEHRRIRSRVKADVAAEKRVNRERSNRLDFVQAINGGQMWERVQQQEEEAEAAFGERLFLECQSATEASKRRVETAERHARQAQHALDLRAQIEEKRRMAASR